MEQKLDVYMRVLCDICGKEINRDNECIKTIRLYPSRAMEKIDVCEQCMQELFEKWKEEEVENEKITKMVARIEEVSK